MTIPDAIKHAYLAVAAGSKLHEREAAQAIVWAVAGWLEAEHGHCGICIVAYCEKARWTAADWLTEAERLLREKTKDG